jgi:hypothetical protein
MKTLSVRQPWAWLIIAGFKQIENRSRFTHIRGRILIHAPMKFDWTGYKWVRETYPKIEMPKMPGFNYGGIIGSAVIDSVITQADSPWFFGKYGYVLKDPKELMFIPCRGQLGFFNALPAIQAAEMELRGQDWAKAQHKELQNLITQWGIHG